MSFYTNMRAVAARLLTNYGAKVEITRNGATVARPYGVWVANDKENMSSPGTSNNSNTTADMRTIVITDVSNAPRVGDTLNAQSQFFSIMKVTAVNPAATNLAYRLEVE